MKIFNFFILLTIILTAGCNNSENYTPGDATLSGNITGAENRQLYIHKEVKGNIDADTIQVSIDGSFAYKTFIDKPTYFTLYVGREQVPLYLKPGDSMDMTADIQRFSEKKFSGNSVIYNDYLAGVEKSESNFGMAMQFVFNQPEKKAVEAMDSLRTEMMNNLNELEKNYKKIDKFFINSEKKRIIYYWAYSHILYPLYYRSLSKDDNFKTSPEYDSYLGDVNINDSSLLFLPEYRQFISNYFNSKVEKYFDDTTISQANPSFTVYQLEQIEKIFTDQAIRDYMSFKILRDHVIYDGIKDYNLIWPMFDKLCQNKKYKTEISNMLAEWEYLKPGKPAKDFSGVTLEGDTVHLSDFKGKYVYVDVWATWCHPCLAEVPSLTRIEKEMKGNNIVFISASVDRDKEAWVKYLKEHEMHGVQIHVGYSRTLSQFYKIRGIPRFMLFDRDGNILEVSADRPSMGVDKKLMKLEGI